NVDMAVIQLDANGQMIDRANVILSRDYPNGLIVPLDSDSGANSVRFRRWDMARFDGGTYSSKSGSQTSTKGWTNNPALTDADDIVPGRQSAPYQFMSPYPASSFKLLIGFKIMRMVDAGTITLDTLYTYSPDGKKGTTRKVRDWMEPMITYSDNDSARAMIKLIHSYGQMVAMHQEFRDLGLPTLQVNGTSTTTGGNWVVGQIHMTAYDTARLLWIIEGGSGTFWTGANGQPVTAAVLSSSSRTYLKGLLNDQGFNDTLTTANMCGNPNARAGIPSSVPVRWIDPIRGTVTVDGYAYGMDVRPCNASAEVGFAHKTGFTFNYCSDVGIVNSLPGQPFRRYIIVYLSNLGYRYADESFATATKLPYYDTNPVPYTQRAAEVGREIDSFLK
ncbi:MAG: serine hydrolase, partial [Limisphaerales bacterium]